MATLQDRIEKILVEGPGTLKCWTRTSLDGSFEISIPYEKGFRSQGYYIRAQETLGEWFSVTYTAGQTVLPKTSFYESESFQEFKRIAPKELEVQIGNLVHGRT